MVRWWEQVAERATVAEVAAEGGLEVHRHRAGPCPACREARTSAGDKRGPMLVRERDRWQCVRCKVGGGPERLARLIVLGTVEAPEREQRDRVRAWCAARGWCDGDGSAAPVIAPMRVRRAEEEEPHYPDREEAHTLWRRSGPVAGDEAAVAWVRDRVAREVGDASAEEVIATIDRCELARVIPVGLRVPGWARCRGAWWSASERVSPDRDGQPRHEGHRLLLRAWDSAGQLVGVRARGIWLGGSLAADTKEVTPGGGLPSGAVYANSAARAILRGQIRRPLDVIGKTSSIWSGLVLVREGGPDWLMASAVTASGPVVPGVLGVWAGAWRRDEAGLALARALHAAMAHVVIATDADRAGDSYARQIADVLDAVGVSHDRRAIGGAA